MKKFIFLFYLSLLSVVGFLATDMYLPAFESMRLDFNTTKNTIASTLSIYLAGFALAQLFWGAFSDKYGKPKTILIGMILFACSSLMIFYTHSLFLLILLRLIQSIGACSAAVSWQAMVIEKYSYEETSKIFATIMPLVGLTPALAPLLGVFILENWGWRYIFMLLFFIALLMIPYTLTLKSKTTKNIHSAQPVVKQYAHFLKSKQYLGNVLIYAFCSAAFFAWLTGSPFFLKELGYNAKQIGWSFLPQTFAFMGGGYGYRLLSSKIDGKRILPYLLSFFTISVISIMLLALFLEKPTLTTLLIPFCSMALANGATYPIVVSEALKRFPNDAGKATGLQNTLQLGACFIASLIVSIFSQSVLLATAITMASTLFVVWFGFRLSKIKTHSLL